MNALSALGGAGRSPQVSGSDGNAQAAGGSGQDFAKLLDGDGNGAPRPKAQGADKVQQQAPADNGASKPPGQADAAEPTRDAQAGEQAVRDSDKPDGADKDARADAADRDDEAGWPPPGLAGFGMAIMPALSAALPATATALGAAGLALGAAAAKGVAGILGDTAATAGAAGAQPGAAPAATGASAAVAAGDFGGLLAQAAAANAQAANAEAAAPLAALAALAGAGDGGAQPAGGDTASPDPSNLLGLGNTPAVSVARSADNAAPFTGSPTPTPNLHGEDFDDALGARMSWLADQKIGHAHIKLNPAELGPVEVRLHLSGDQVNASFSSSQADVRQALENSLPRLREMLGQQGFQLGQADVGSQQRNASSQNPAQPGFGAGGDSGDDGLAGVGIPAAALRQRGLLDAYA